MEVIGVGLLLVVALAVVIVFTRGVFSRDLTNALKRVNQQEQALQEQADLIEQRLAQLERDYQLKLKRAEAEAERVLQEAKHQAMNIRTAAIEEAKHRARQLLLEAEQGKAQLKAELTKELDGLAVQRACDALRRLLAPADLSSLHRALTDQALQALEHLQAEAMRASVPSIEVTTAQPLSEPQAQQLRHWIASGLGASVSAQVRVDPSLVAGCIVRVGSTIVDSSLASRLNTP